MSRIDEINARMADYGIGPWPTLVKDCNYLLHKLEVSQALLAEARKLLKYARQCTNLPTPEKWNNEADTFLAKTAPGVDTR